MYSVGPFQRVKKPNTDGCLPTCRANWSTDLPPVTPE
jgi:hypothetical protein